MNEIILYPILWFTLAFLFWVLMSELSRRRIAKMQMEVRLRLLDKLTASDDVANLMQGEAGAKILANLGPNLPDGFASGIVRMTQIGVVLVGLGLGAFTLAAINIAGAGAAPVIIGTLATSIGGGFLAAAAVAWRLGSRMGLLAREKI